MDKIQQDYMEASRNIELKYQARLKESEELGRQCAASLKSLKIGDSLLETAKFPCKPDHINTTETGRGSYDQVVYETIGYLYFDNGSLVARQMLR